MAEAQRLASRHRLKVVKRMRGFAVVLANSTELSDLSVDGAVGHLSGDPRVHGSTIISDVSTAADQTRAGNVLVAGLTGIPGVNGQGIGIAIVDSGIAPHSALSQRVVANVSFITGDSQVTDEFGHGTHVAGIIAGSAAPASGVAPGASLVNVRVLSADGSGYTSDVIAGRDATRDGPHNHWALVLRPVGRKRRVPMLVAQTLQSIDTILDAFTDHLRRNRGVSPATCERSARDVRKLLARTCGGAPLDVSQLTTAALRAFVLEQASRWSPRTVRRSAPRVSGNPSS